MKLKDWLIRWNLNSLRINTVFLEAEFTLNDADRNAAWDLYVELLTRIATQPLPKDGGYEKSALLSIHSLFGITRDILHQHGRSCIQFSKIAIVILNQIIRPFTAKWHPCDKREFWKRSENRTVFRNELAALQKQLLHYAGLLSEIAEVENLVQVEKQNRL